MNLFSKASQGLRNNFLRSLTGFVPINQLRPFVERDSSISQALKEIYL